LTDVEICFTESTQDSLHKVDEEPASEYQLDKTAEENGDDGKWPHLSEAALTTSVEGGQAEPRLLDSALLIEEEEEREEAIEAIQV
jgi:hypothetical protein